MSKSFYAKLAAINVKKNAKTYIPFILSCIGTVMLYYIMCSLSLNEGLNAMSGGNEMKTILSFGSYVIAIFSVIFLFYTNSFLLKRRKKEFGLFNILGMEKKHIMRIVFFETLYVAIISLAVGLALGIIADKLMFLMLLKILHFSIQLGFHISVSSIISTLILFGVIFALSFFNALRQIHFSKPVELLKGGQVGEKEPKTRWVLTIIGLIALGIAYYIALTTESPLSALTLFFIAVLLVIVGTYALFISGSIALLKILRKNKKYYYRTKHFISISGMIYRMKQNAVGLANICILSTAVLITLSTTFSLYIGMEDVVRTRYIRNIEVISDGIEEGQIGLLHELVGEETEKIGVKAENEVYYRFKDFTLIRDKNNFTGEGDYNSVKDMDKINIVTVFTLSEYNRLSGKNETLDEGQVLIYSKNNSLEGEINICGIPFKVKKELDSMIVEDRASQVVDSYYVVVSDKEIIDAITESAGEGHNNSEQMSYYYGFDIQQEGQIQVDLYNSIAGRLNDSGLNAYADGAEASKGSFYSIYGGLFFIGIFLGLVFIMATVLIIYYKQVSEGYDDRERFEIMQKVGMSYQEIKSSIRSQILTVFFLPLITAVIHIAFAFKVITKLLVVFNLTNVPLFAWCSVGTILAFTLFYVLVYMLTARVYYKIVR